MSAVDALRPDEIQYSYLTDTGSSSLKATMDKISHILDGKYSKRDGRMTEDSEGVLIFVSGNAEAVGFFAAFMVKFPKFASYGRVLHSEVKSDDRDSIISMKAPKFIFATNVAMSNITLKEITHVIDCGFYELKVFDCAFIEALLKPIAESKELAKQRALSGGRFDGAWCHRIFTEEVYNKMVERTIDPWIPGDCLEFVIWWLQMFPGLNPSNQNFLLAPNHISVQPPPFVINWATKQLGLHGVATLSSSITSELPTQVSSSGIPTERVLKLTPYGATVTSHPILSWRAAVFFSLSKPTDSPALKSCMAYFALLIDMQTSMPLIAHHPSLGGVHSNARPSREALLSLAAPGLVVGGFGDLVADYVELSGKRSNPLHPFYKVNPRFKDENRKKVKKLVVELGKSILAPNFTKFSSGEVEMSYRMLCAFPDKLIQITGYTYDKSRKNAAVRAKKFYANVDCIIEYDAAYCFERLGYSYGEYFLYFAARTLGAGVYYVSRIHRISGDIVNRYNKEQWNGTFFSVHPQTALWQSDPFAR